VLALALTAPLTLVVGLLALTAILPYEVQKHYAIYAAGLPGLLPSDALLLGGMVRAALVLPHLSLDRGRRLIAAAMCAFIALVAVECAIGLTRGRDVSVVGAEFRHLAGFATLLIAMPLMDDPLARRRLSGWLLALGLALGLWGIAQWSLGISFGGIGDVGVREGVNFTSAGRGQLQGGMFCFPVAVVLAAAALISGAIRGLAASVVVVLVLLLNAVALLVTFERTLWIATLLALVVLVMRVGNRGRWRAIVWAPIVLALMVTALHYASPQTITTAEQRLRSVTDYSSDTSLRYRQLESRHVLDQIRAHRLAGSALGAAVFWGRPASRVKAHEWTYTHNGYLWVAWKIGIAGALLLVTMIVAGIAWRGPPRAEPLFVAVRLGAQSALLAFLLIALTFPVFNALSTSALIGVLLAMTAVPRDRLRSARAGAYH